MAAYVGPWLIVVRRTQGRRTELYVEATGEGDVVLRTDTGAVVLEAAQSFGLISILSDAGGRSRPQVPAREQPPPGPRYVEE